MKVRRLTKKEELDIMLPETNENNLEVFRRVLPDFYLEEKFNKKILKEIDNETRSKNMRYLDDLLQLNEQKRAWFEVPLTEENDEAYKFYRNMIQSIDVEQYNLNISDLIDYKNFANNRIRIEKKEYKLFSLLLKKEILNQYDLDSINRLKGGFKYFCISRNPIDYLMCSTAQPFTTCESLDSEYEGCYFMGLPSLNLDPNRFMIFTTKGKLSRYTIKGNTIKYFRYHCRTFVISVRNNIFALVRYYPNRLFDMGEILSAVTGIETIDNIIDYEGDLEGRFWFEYPKYINGQPAFIYLDNIGLRQDSEDGELVTYSLNHGSTGSSFAYEFSCIEGFNQIRDFEDLTGIKCCYCGDHYPEDRMTYIEYYGDVCENCYEERFRECRYCDSEIYIQEEGYYIQESDFYLCNDCYHENYTICEYCGLEIPIEKAIPYKDELLCNDCYEELEEEEKEALNE